MQLHVHRRLHRCFSLLLGALVLAGCGGPPAGRDYAVTIEVVSDSERPLAGAEVRQGSRSIGRSGSDGRVSLLLRGTEGQTLVVSVECPEGHRPPSEPLAIVLRRIAEADRRPVYRARCEPRVRQLVVALRAENGPNLPVLALGREVARTDADGAAHVLLAGAPGDTIELTLDTSGNSALRPQRPSARFEVAPRDEVVLFAQRFELPAPPPRPRRRPSRIIRIGGR